MVWWKFLLRSPTSPKLNLRIGFEFDNQPWVDSFSWFRYVSNDFNAFDISFDASSSRPFPPPQLLCSLFIQSLHLLSLHSEDQTLKIHLPWDRWYKENRGWKNLEIITRSWWRLDENHRKWMKMIMCGEIILQKKREIWPNGWEDQMTSAAGIVSPKVPAMGKRPSTDVSLCPMAT